MVLVWDSSNAQSCSAMLPGVRLLPVDKPLQDRAHTRSLWVRQPRLEAQGFLERTKLRCMIA